MLQKKHHVTERGTIVYWTDDSAGEGAPWIVFLPGLTADHRLFDDQMTYFSGKANCLVWDPPAHGLSRPFSHDFCMDDMAEMLHQILDGERIERPVLVGQSMGGYVSQAYLDLYPDGASGFVSIDSAPLKRAYYPDWEVKFLSHTEGMYRVILWWLLKRWGARGTSTTERGRRQMRSFMDDYSKDEYVRLTAFGYKILADAIRAERPYQISCPCLLLCGTKDRAGDVIKFNKQWSAGEGLELVWIQKAGHNANVDAPQIVNEQIYAFLAKTRSSAKPISAATTVGSSQPKP